MQLSEDLDNWWVVYPPLSNRIKYMHGREVVHTNW